MLLHIGEGVILDALLKLGFTCTYDDVDLARLTYVDGSHRISVDVTHELVHREEDKSPLPYEPPVGLVSSLSWLHHQLSKVDCQFDLKAYRADQSTEAVFARHDTVTAPRLGRPMTTKVIVRARVERAKKEE